MPSRSIVTRDLVELRDFGPGDSRLSGNSPFAISPDGRSAALLLRRGSISSNTVCTGLVIIELATGRARLIDTGVGFLRDQSDFRHLGDLRSSFPTLVAPRFTSDGKTLFYLKPMNDTPQVWRSNLTDARADQVTHSPVPVITFDLSADERKLLYASRPGLVPARAVLAAEGQRGWVYDERFWSVQRSSPFPINPDPTISALDLATGAIAAAKDDTWRGTRLDPVSQELEAHSRDNRIQGRVAPDNDRAFESKSRMIVSLHGRRVTCPAEVCDDPIWGVWSLDDRLMVLRTRHETKDGTLELLAWQPGARSASRLWSSRARLFGCQRLRSDLLCGFDDANRPARLVTISLRNGSMRTIWNPNPYFDTLHLGKVERVTWTASDGVAAYGDLVLPPDHSGKAPLPLIVVQYESRGFLRGGSGGDYPVHLLAAAGYAVLSLHQPRSTGERGRGARTLDEYQKRMTDDFWYRRRLLASLAAAVDLVIQRKIADPTRIGLTGQSDGAATVCFALSSGYPAAAVAISSGCEDPATYMSAVGPSFGDALRRWGYPQPYSCDTDFWRRLSPALNANHIVSPILIQSADTEHRLALEMIQAFRQQHRAIEMLVYPDEDHVKWQPVHRAAVFDTTIAWFDFWLKGRLPVDQAQRERWVTLRQKSERAPKQVRTTSGEPNPLLPQE